MNCSVVLTLYNEEKGLQRVLDYLSTQREIIDEVIAISDACHDGTNEILLKWYDREDQFKKSITLRESRYGRGNAISLGLSHSRNDLCIIMAGDMQPLSKSLPNLLQYFKDPRVGAATGHPILLNSYRTIGDCLSHVMWKSHNQVGETTTEEGRFFHLNGEMYGIRKSALKQGDFYNCLNEDNMIGYLIKRNGFLVMWAKDVQYFMRYPSGFWEWLKIRKRSCYGRIELVRRTHLKQYGFYELQSRDYILNVWRIGVSNLRFFASLIIGVPTEFLVRSYYRVMNRDLESPFTELWQPAAETKW